MMSRILSSSSLLLLLLLLTPHSNLSSASDAKVQNVTTTTATSTTTSKSSTSTAATTTTVAAAVKTEDAKNKTETNLLSSTVKEIKEVEEMEIEAETEKNTEATDIDLDGETTTMTTVAIETEDNKIENEKENKKSVNETTEASGSRKIKRQVGNINTGLGLDGPLGAGDVGGGKAGTFAVSVDDVRRRRRRSASASPLNLDLSKYISIGWGPPRRVKLPPPPPARVVVKNVPVPEVHEVHHVHYLKAAATQAPFRQTSINTQTQSRFFKINHNYQAALRFQQSPAVQNTPNLARQLVVKAGQITCEDVCTHGKIYGLIGICTIDYCICEGKQNFHHEQRQCPGDRIFDPMRLACTDPRKSTLCSDDDIFSSHDAHSHGHSNSNSQNQAYGVPNSNYQTTNQEYGAPNSNYQIQSSYGLPAAAQPANPNSQYGLPTQSAPGSGYSNTYLFANTPAVSGLSFTQAPAVLQSSSSSSASSGSSGVNQAWGNPVDSYAPNYVQTIPASGSSTPAVDEVLTSGGFYDPNQFTNTNTYGASSPTFSYGGSSVSSGSGSSSSSSSNPHLSSPSNLNSYVTFIQ